MKKEIRNELEDRADELKKLIKYKNRALEHHPSGMLRVAKSKKQYQYFIRETSAEKTGKYIPKAKRSLAIKLAKKEYDQKLIRSAEGELRYIEEILSNDNGVIWEDIYKNMHPAKRALVKPDYLSDEDYIAQWLHQDIEKLDDKFQNADYETNNGDMMRSKSELLIMNLLEKYGIPYIYEKPIHLKGYGQVVPDFTILEMKNRKEVIWEHLGRMGEEDYRNKNLRKIEAYEKNGYYLGENLLVTYELSTRDFDVVMVEKKLKSFLGL